MNRRHFLLTSIATSAVALPEAALSLLASSDAEAASAPGVAVLLVDTDRATAPIDQRIYGQFLEHINHSVEDGLFAEQIRGCGFEGEDFKTYWEPFSDRGSAECVDVEFQNGKNSVRLQVQGGRAGIRQGRLFIDAGHAYDGSLWVRREAGSPQLTLRIVGSQGALIASVPLGVTGSAWQEVHYSFSSPVRDARASVEIAAAGSGTLLLDFVSMKSRERVSANSRH
jgi:alpha-N-arabinofuranosidase